MLKIYKNDIYVGYGYGCDGSYKLRLDPIFAQSILNKNLNMNIGIKSGVINESSFVVAQ